MKRPASKRKKTATKTTTPRRRKRVSGIFGSGDVMNTVALIAGGIAAREANNILQKVMPGTLSPTMVAIAQIAAGFVLPSMVKNSFVRGMGDGFKVMGGASLAVSMGVISGVSNSMSYQINGTSNLQAINGNRRHVVNGTGALIPVNGVPKSKRQFGNFA